jgi:hypothetical protein
VISSFKLQTITIANSKPHRLLDSSIFSFDEAIFCFQSFDYDGATFFSPIPDYNGLTFCILIVYYDEATFCL